MCVCCVLDCICVWALMILAGRFGVRMTHVLVTSLRVLSVDTCVCYMLRHAHVRA